MGWFDVLFNSNADFNDTKTINSSVNFAKKVTYKPKRRDVRVRGKSRKDAEKKAKKRGGGKKPISHSWSQKDGKWIPPHFHPNVPKGHPFHHDHYFYPLLILLGLFDVLYEDDN